MLGDSTAFAVHVVLAFFMTPFVLRSLGDGRYGVWAVMTGLTGYYGLLDLGLRGGMTQHLARSLGLRDFDRFNRDASTGLAALTVCGSVIVAITFAASALAPRI